MELLTDLGTRTTITSTGKKDTRRWGIFKCPVCLGTVELQNIKGTKNNTCGKAGCRSLGSSEYGSWNKAIPQEQQVKNKLYYSSIGDYYRRLKSSSTLCEEWSTLSGFMTDMYDKYLELRSSGIAHLTLKVSDTKDLSISNCAWAEDKVINVDFTNDSTNGKYHSRMLAKELNVKPYLVTRALSKMPESFGPYTYEAINLTPTKTTKAYILSKYQYDRLHDLMLTNTKKSSTNVYLLESSGYVKIGIAHDIDKRLSTLIGANPNQVNKLYSKTVINAKHIESQLHTKYAEFNHHHEWFKLNDTQVKEIITYLDSVK